MFNPSGDADCSRKGAGLQLSHSTGGPTAEGCLAAAFPVVGGIE